MNGLASNEELSQLSYSRLLRTLGQVLEPANVHDFELQIAGEDLVVAFQNLLPQSSWQRLRRYFIQEPIDQPRTELKYSRAELEQLEHQYRKLAVDGNRIPDRHSLPQILRVVGTYVDQKQAELMSLSRREASLLITYRNPNGEIQIEDLLYLDVDGIFVREIRLRQRKDANNAKGDATAEASHSSL
ncbi:MAG TPA: hypothetical protein VH985_06965 [Candidatus Binatia bacterium]|jgi:hypothetical protein